MTALMPRATAIWLIENTALTFQQIADVTGLHTLEIQALADGDVASSMQGLDPILNNQLTREEIERCEQDPQASLQLIKKTHVTRSKKTAKYIPINKRSDKPNAIAWLVKKCPELSDSQIAKLIGSTKKTVQAIRGKTHWNAQQLQPESPVSLGLCSQREIERELQKNGATLNQEND